MELHGVNIGGWLLLEKWITPSLFEGLEARDEYSFCRETAATGHQKLQQHRDTFITKADFEWLAGHGINALRIPVGYWALQDEPPFVNCRQQLDQAFKWADNFDLKVIIDLHGAPGSQNGHDHSGRIGAINWTNGKNIERTLDTIGKLAERYHKEQSLWGIELLNEPGWDVPLDTLRDFYERGYRRVREHCSESVAVIISDAFRPRDWDGFMSGAEYKNVVLDMHLYQGFSDYDKALSLQEHLDKAQSEWTDTIGQSDKPVIVGEWSLGLDSRTFAGMDKSQRPEALKAYADAQLSAFDHGVGWFFWNYKTEDMPAWNYRYLVEADLIA